MKRSRPDRRRHINAGASSARSAERLDVVSQLACAIRNPHAALIGAVLGGIVPWLGRTLAHAEIPRVWADGSPYLAIAMAVAVLGCACFSGISVYKLGRVAFEDRRKALGFVIALEGVLVLSSGHAGTLALALLIVINAVANGSVIALARDATLRRREADQRRVQTRRAARAVRVAPMPMPMPMPMPAPAPAPVPASVTEFDAFELDFGSDRTVIDLLADSNDCN